MIGWIREGKLKPRISKIYKLEEALQAFMDMAARKVTGKVVIAPQAASSSATTATSM